MIPPNELNPPSAITDATAPIGPPTASAAIGFAIGAYCGAIKLTTVPANDEAPKPIITFLSVGLFKKLVADFRLELDLLDFRFMLLVLLDVRFDLTFTDFRTLLTTFFGVLRLVCAFFRPAAILFKNAVFFFPVNFILIFSIPKD